MKMYPKWLLALAGSNLICLLLIPFFLFGGLEPFGTSDSGFVRFLLYVLTNLLWVVPVACFFGSLVLYGNFRQRLGTAVAVFGLLLTVADICLLFLS